MSKKSALFALTWSVVLLSMLVFTPRSQWLETSALYAVLLLLTAGLLTPAIRAFVSRRRRTVMIAGGCVIVTGVGALVASLLLGASTEVVASVFSASLLVGILLLMLPRLVASVSNGVEAQNNVRNAAPASQQFQPTLEVRRTLAVLAARSGPLLRVVGPWFLIFCLLPLLLIGASFWKPLQQNRDLAALFLLGLLAVLIAVICLLLVATLQWARFIVTNREPSWSDFPAKALWGLLWRWLVFGAVFRVTGEIEPWLRAHLPGAVSWEVTGLRTLIVLALLVLASPFALALPAIALGVPNKSAEARMKGMRAAGRGYYIGAALLLAPYCVGSWLLDLASEAYKGSSMLATWAFLDALLLFIAFIVGSTYVARIYVKGMEVPVAS